MACTGFAQTDDFNDGNSAGWTLVDPLSVLGAPFMHQQVVNNQLVLTADGSPNSAAYGPGRGGLLRQDVVHEKFCIAVDVLDWDPARENALGLFARVQPGVGLQQTAGYSFTYQTDDKDIDINKITGEQPATISEGGEAGGVVDPAGAVKITLEQGSAYRFVFFGDGAYLEGRVYELGNLVTPLAIVRSTQGTAYTRGTTGILIYDNSAANVQHGAKATFDNYSALDVVAPALSIVRSALYIGSPLGLEPPLIVPGVSLQWSPEPRCWDLEAAEDPAGPWVALAKEQYSPDGGSAFAATGGTRAGFFRLRPWHRP